MHTTDLKTDEAFLIYLRLGPKRSLQAVAEQMGVHISTVRRWEKTHHWNEQIQSIHEEAIKNQKQREGEWAVVKANQQAEWEKRANAMREIEWVNSQVMMDTGRDLVQKFNSGEVDKGVLADATRLIYVGSKLARKCTTESEDKPTNQPPAEKSAIEEMREAWARITAPTVEIISPSDPEPASTQN